MSYLLVGYLLIGCQASCGGGGCGEGGVDVTTASSDSDISDSDEAARRADLARGAARRGAFLQAKDVAFYARELAKLNPGSDRAKASRRARQILDEMVVEPNDRRSQ